MTPPGYDVVVTKQRRPAVLLIALAVAVIAAIALWPPTTTPAADEPDDVAEPVRDPKPVASQRPAPALSGVVAQRANGLPIANAMVRAVCGETGRITHSDSRGHFAVHVLPAGECTVTAEADGYVAGGPDPRVSTQITSRPGSPLSDVELRLHKSATASGRVLVNDAPAKGVTLSVLYVESSDHEGPFSMSFDAVTGADGRFSLRNLGPGRIRVLAEHPDHGLAESPSRFLRAGGAVDDITIHLTDTGSVAGTVVDQSGRAIPRAKVLVRRQDGVRQPHTETDAEGRFDLPGVRAGEILVVARAYGFRQSEAAAATVAADDISEVRLVLMRRPGFGGRVSTPDGSPASGAAVYVQRSDHQGAARPVTQTDAEGRFWLDAPPPPPSIAFARHTQYGPSERVPIAGSEADLDLTLSAGGKLTGLVVDPQHQPISAYRVTLHRSGRRALEVRDPSGRFMTQSLAPDRYAVVVTAPNRPPVVTHRFEVHSGRDTDVGTIVVGRGGSVAGMVIDGATGEPVAAAGVRPEGGRGSATNAEGLFTLNGLGAAKTSIWVRARGYVPRLISAVRPSEGAQVDIGTVALTRTSGGRPRMQYSGVGIQIRLSPDRIFLDKVFAGGPASEAGLKPGTAVTAINGFAVGDLTGRQAVEMIRGEPGSEVTLEIETPNGAEIIALQRADVDTDGS